MKSKLTGTSKYAARKLKFNDLEVGDFFRWESNADELHARFIKQKVNETSYRTITDNHDHNVPVGLTEVTHGEAVVRYDLHLELRNPQAYQVGV